MDFKLAIHNAWQPPQLNLTSARVKATIEADGSFEMFRWHDVVREREQRTTAQLAEALQVVSLANAAFEKAIAAHYERTRRPEEFVYQGWIELCESQSAGAIEALLSEPPDALVLDIMLPPPGGFEISGEF